MAQHYNPKVGTPLEIKGNYYNTLDIEAFSQMMKDPSYCYKFYWLEAMVHLGRTGTMFRRLIIGL